MQKLQATETGNTDKIWSDLRSLRSLDQAHRELQDLENQVRGLRRGLRWVILLSLLALMGSGATLTLTLLMYRSVPPALSQQPALSQPK